MIEVGIFDVGATDLPFKKTASGIRVLDATLKEQIEASQRLQQAQVRRAVLADRLGFDYWWMGEHHFGIEGAELSTNPIQIETAVAALTSRIRLGQIANIISFWHPLRLAEQTAILDILSGGRAEVGIGRGYQSREAEVFGHTYGSGIQDQERNRSYYAEAYELLMKAWTQESFSHKGEFFTVPPSYTKWNHAQTIAYFAEGDAGRDLDEVFRIGPPDAYSSGPPVMASTTTLKEITVQPQPLQNPHPPLWEPLNSERTIRWAAEKGVNGNFIFETDAALKKKIDIYMEAAEAAGWPDYMNRGQFKHGWDAQKHRGVSSGRIIHIQDPSLKHADIEKHGESQMFQWDFFKPFGFAAILANPGEKPDPNLNVTADLLRDKGVVLHGTKDQIIEGMMSLKEHAYGDGDFITNLWFESCGLGHEVIEEQIQFFGEEILPVLRQECGGGPDLPEVNVPLTPDYPARGAGAGAA